MDCPPLLLFHVPTPNGTAIENNKPFLSHALELPGWYFSHRACFQLSTNGCRTDNQERLQSMQAKARPLHLLAERGIHYLKRFLWWKAQVLRYTLAPHVFFSTAAKAFLPFQSARGSIFRSPKARFWLWLGVFFSSLHHA